MDDKISFTDSNQQLFSVIVIDDDDLDRKAIKRLFNKNQVKNPVYEATNGVEGLHLLNDLHDKGVVDDPMIIFVDINMPMMDGFEFLKAVKGDPRFMHIPVFMLTTSGSNFDLSKAEKSGAMAFFNKFEMSEDEEQFIHDVSVCCSVV